MACQDQSAMTPGGLSVATSCQFVALGVCSSSSRSAGIARPVQEDFPRVRIDRFEAGIPGGGEDVLAFGFGQLRTA